MNRCCRFCKHLNPHSYECETYNSDGSVSIDELPTLCRAYKDSWGYDIDKDCCGNFESIYEYEVEKMSDLLNFKSDTHFILLKDLYGCYYLNDLECKDLVPDFFKSKYKLDKDIYYVNGYILAKDGSESCYIPTHFLLEDWYKETLKRYNFKRK